MTNDDRFEQLLADMLADVAPTRQPDRLIPEILRAARRERRWPRWLALIKEPPMRISSRVAVGSPTLRLASVMALTMALVLAAAAAVVVAASPPPSPVHTVLAPFGPARNGSLVYEVAGDIWAADATGSNGVPIISGPTFDHAPWFSHDGTRIAFTRDAADGTAQLMVARSDGTGIVPVTSDFKWADWSPDDKQFVVAHTVDGQEVISIVAADGSGVARTFDLGGVKPADWVAWRPTDGKEILFGGYPGAGPDVALYSMGSDGVGLHAITPAIAPESPGAGTFANPRVSPDGSTIVYWTWRQDNGGLAHLLDLATGNDRMVDSFGGSISQFSPDSSTVIGQGDHHLVIQPVDGSSPGKEFGPSFADQMGHQFEFSPDGTKVFLTIGSPGTTTMIDVATGESSVIQTMPNYPSWQRLAPAP
jgi:dipeptidyl aminopeptidase/acylaminoacyl peptidase